MTVGGVLRISACHKRRPSRRHRKIDVAVFSGGHVVGSGLAYAETRGLARDLLLCTPGDRQVRTSFANGSITSCSIASQPHFIAAPWSRNGRSDRRKTPLGDFMGQASGTKVRGCCIWMSEQEHDEPIDAQATSGVFTEPSEYDAAIEEGRLFPHNRRDVPLHRPRHLLVH